MANGNLVDTGCMFECSASIPSISLYRGVQGNAKCLDSGNSVLTSDVKIISVNHIIYCEKKPLPTTPPAYGLCEICLTNWRNTSDKITLNGEKALIDKSENTCIFGGIIKPKGSSKLSSQVSGSISSIMINIPSNDDNKQAKEKINEKIPNDNSKENIAQISDDDIHNSNKKTPRDVLKELSDEKKDEIYRKYANCRYKECKERNDCPYYTALHVVDNKSAVLRENFEEENNIITEYLKEQEKAITKQRKGIWTNAAHHLICGNEVFLAPKSSSEPIFTKDDSYDVKMQKRLDIDIIFGELVKLSQFAGYDINHIKNGILLPTTYKAEDEKLLTDTDYSKGDVEKRADAYEVMSIMKKQWHVGPHHYKINKEELHYFKENSGILQKNSSMLLSNTGGCLFPQYEDVVKDMLRKLYITYYSKPRCWKKWQDTDKKLLIKRLNKISEEVRGALNKFKEDPRASYPCYVSKATILYAFDLPKSDSIVVIYYSLGGKKIAARYRVERFNKNDNRIVIKIVSKNPVFLLDYYDENNLQNVIDFIEFCRNTRFFYLEHGLPFHLPFYDMNDSHIVHKFYLKDEKRRIDHYLNEYANDVVSVLQSKNFSEYVTDGVMIEKRIDYIKANFE